MFNLELDFDLRMPEIRFWQLGERDAGQEKRPSKIAAFRLATVGALKGIVPVVRKKRRMPSAQISTAGPR